MWLSELNDYTLRKNLPKEYIQEKGYETLLPIKVKDRDKGKEGWDDDHKDVDDILENIVSMFDEEFPTQDSHDDYDQANEDDDNNDEINDDNEDININEAESHKISPKKKDQDLLNSYSNDIDVNENKDENTKVESNIETNDACPTRAFRTKKVENIKETNDACPNRACRRRNFEMKSSTEENATPTRGEDDIEVICAKEDENVDANSSKKKKKNNSFWKKCEKTLSKEESKTLVAEALGILCKVIMNHHVYKFAGKTKLQQGKGCIGDEAIGVIALLIMIWWSRQFKNKIDKWNIVNEMLTRPEAYSCAQSQVAKVAQ